MSSSSSTGPRPQAHDVLVQFNVKHVVPVDRDLGMLAAHHQAIEVAIVALCLQVIESLAGLTNNQDAGFALREDKSLLWVEYFGENLAQSNAELRRGGYNPGPTGDMGYLSMTLRVGVASCLGLADGKRHIHPEHPKGHYFTPTLLVDVTPDMDIANEECFVTWDVNLDAGGSSVLVFVALELRQPDVVFEQLVHCQRYLVLLLGGLPGVVRVRRLLLLEQPGVGLDGVRCAERDAGSELGAMGNPGINDLDACFDDVLKREAGAEVPDSLRGAFHKFCLRFNGRPSSIASTAAASLDHRANDGIYTSFMSTDPLSNTKRSTTITSRLLPPSSDLTD
ncbi:uncharacterized protein LY79DRAFT_679581 [Colletotrichum navitas]|uniref:Uncharacterized protein n=1 Tax=Colletotrichum navitas TaxID=681940 RepID=A0AAD8PKX5_9PEZI|nr:uncharacterized protein LY79DRAFT_679581 [Colletotrichum navitas]KAK1569636.1 hypothetical protein LY79DRAFT_679581 [Colletotrichum navitas]